MITVLKAQHILHEWALKHKLTQTRVVPLEKASGLSLATSCMAPMDLPPFDNSAMDGFALHSLATSGALSTKPLDFKIIGTIRAGDPPGVLQSHEEVFRIMTGAPLPLGANAVIKKEDVEERDGQIRIKRSVKQGSHVRYAGEDIHKGQEALPLYTRLNPGRVAFLASLGMKEVTVIATPRVSLVVTGEELVDHVDDLAPGKIMDSNSSFLKAALACEGFSFIHAIKSLDQPEAIKEAISRSLEMSDIVLVTGGVSVGDYDYTKEILKDLGVQELFWKVSQKPGKPLYAGTYKDSLVLGLPGNPYSVFVAYYMYVRFVLLSLMGVAPANLIRVWLPVSTEVKGDEARDSFLKGRILSKFQHAVVEPLKGQGSHQLRALGQTDGLIMIPAGKSSVPAGELVEVYLLP